MKRITLVSARGQTYLEIDGEVVSPERARLCINACEGIPDYQLTGENGESNRLGETIDHLRSQISLVGESHPLKTIFDQCIDQAVSGKGEERHGHGAPFMEQPWHQIADRQVLGFLVGQAEKKIGEATAMIQQNQGRDGVEFWQKEIRGAINYLAMAMLYVEEQVAAMQADQAGCGNCQACAAAAEEKAAPMTYDPVTGVTPFPGPFFPEAYRSHNGPVAWLFNPWTGEKRDPLDVGTDPAGHLIAPF